MAETLRPGQESTKALFQRRLNQSSELHSELTRGEAAALEVQSGILGPLEVFGTALGLSDEQRGVIIHFAHSAAQEARGRAEQDEAANVMFRIDSALKDAYESARNNPPVYDRTKLRDNFFIARARLRTAQQTIKDHVRAAETMQIATERVTGVGNNEKREKAIEGLTDRRFQLTGSANFRYVELVEGQLNNRQMFEPLVAVFVAPEVIVKVHELAAPLQTASLRGEQLLDQPTPFEGVFAQFRHISRSYRETVVHFGLAFNQDAVREIAESPDLPELEGVLPRSLNVR